MANTEIISERQMAAILLSASSVVWLMGGVSTFFVTYVEAQTLEVPGGNGLVGQALRFLVDLLPLSCLVATAGGWLYFVNRRYAEAFRLQALPFVHLLAIALAVTPVAILCGADACF